MKARKKCENPLLNGNWCIRDKGHKGDCHGAWVPGKSKRIRAYELAQNVLDQCHAHWQSETGL